MADNRHWRNRSNRQCGHRHQEYAFKNKYWKKEIQVHILRLYKGCTTKYQFIEGRCASKFLCYVINRPLNDLFILPECEQKRISGPVIKDDVRQQLEKCNSYKSTGPDN